MSFRESIHQKIQTPGHLETPSEWVNWSGSLRFSPGALLLPGGEAELANLIRQAGAANQSVRAVGNGHSSTPLVETEDLLVSLEKFQGVEGHNTAEHWATVQAGMSLKEAGRALLDVGLAMHNLGDVNVQTISGAIATGTHGTGRSLQNLSAKLIGVRLVNGFGEVAEITEDQDPDFLQAARVSLGVLGIFTALKLRLLPAYQLHRREWCTHMDDCLDHFDSLSRENRNVDFYWYPRSDEAKIRTWDLPGQGSPDIPFARLVSEQVGWSYEVLSKERSLKFDEMEYALPAEAGPECFQEVRKRVKARHRKSVGWRVLYRTVAADDAYLSPAYQRDSVTISLHQNASLPFWEYFKDIEPIFLDYGGRPHWAKKHTLRAEQLSRLYPMWDRFLEIRRRVDPEGVFLTPYLRKLLLEE